MVIKQRPRRRTFAFEFIFVWPWGIDKTDLIRK